MPDEVAFSREAAEAAEQMAAIARIAERWKNHEHTSWLALEKIRELLTPTIVRVGQPHNPEVQS